MGIFPYMIGSIIANNRAKRQTRRAVKSIEQNNELRRNITRYEPSDIEGFIESDSMIGSYIISGGKPYYRNRGAASIAACSLTRGIPVVILHEGDSNLENTAKSLLPGFTNALYMIKQGASIYDPFFNRGNMEIWNLIYGSLRNASDISGVGMQYVFGIAEYIRTKGIPPYCDMFVRCPYDTLYDTIDESENRGKITAQRAQQIRGMLTAGQAERANVQSFFSQLSFQGGGILADKARRSNCVNVKAVASKNGAMIIDIGSSANDLLVNLIMNEIKEIVSSGKRIMLILDGIQVGTNDTLTRIVKALSARCLTTFLSDDVYATLGADDNMFFSLAGNANMNFIFSHSSGVSCTKWAEVLGYYEVDKVSQSMQYSPTLQFGLGGGASSSISVNKNREYVVNPEEIFHMNDNELYILIRSRQELAYTTLR